MGNRCVPAFRWVMGVVLGVWSVSKLGMWYVSKLSMWDAFLGNEGNGG